MNRIARVWPRWVVAATALATGFWCTQALSQPYTRTAGDSLQHLSGYAFVGYASSDADKSFNTLGFNPIVHFTYRDQLLFEGELELEAGAEGETEVALEYGTVDWLFSDYASLVAGKFLSPLGNFFQNLHPAWINKLPTAPLGFGHAGAAPLADIGMQVRGGFAAGDAARLSYALYVGNGPELEGEGPDEIHAIETEGFARDVDGKKVVGGRLAWLPWPNGEIAVSIATGKTTVTTMDGIEVVGDPARDYDVQGADLWVRPVKWLEFRGEYIEQEVADQAASVAPMGGKWEAWYGQAAARLGEWPWEIVLRYGEFTTPHNPPGQRQFTPGILYHIASHAQAKLAFERNSGDPAMGPGPLDDRVLVQLAYGF